MIIIFNNIKFVDVLHKMQRKTLLFLIFYAVTCPPLFLEYGEITYTTSLLPDELYLRHGYSVGTMASFSCYEFHNREGSSSMTCQSSGNWSGSIPICSACNKMNILLYFYVLTGSNFTKLLICSL